MSEMILVEKWEVKKEFLSPLLSVLSTSVPCWQMLLLTLVAKQAPHLNCSEDVWAWS